MAPDPGACRGESLADESHSSSASQGSLGNRHKVQDCSGESHESENLLSQQARAQAHAGSEHLVLAAGEAAVPGTVSSNYGGGKGVGFYRFSSPDFKQLMVKTGILAKLGKFHRQGCLCKI